jgi:hypothetical protein
MEGRVMPRSSSARPAVLRAPLLAVLATLATGCAHLDYVGQSFLPTTGVDVYFSKADVPCAYQVMGQMIASGDQFISAERVQERIIAQAREKGADGVVILRVGRAPLAHQSRLQETPCESKDDQARKVERTGITTDAPIDGIEIRALFIKYSH